MPEIALTVFAGIAYMCVLLYVQPVPSQQAPVAEVADG